MLLWYLKKILISVSSVFVYFMYNLNNNKKPGYR